MAIKQLKKQFPPLEAACQEREEDPGRAGVSRGGKKLSPPGSHIGVPLNELTGTPSIKDARIMTISEMERFITQHNRQLIRFPIPSRKRYLNLKSASKF